MVLIAPVLMGIVLFYWRAFSFTVAAWLKTIVHLLGGNFIRASLWFNAGVWMRFWWFDKPHDWDTMIPGVVFFTSLGVLATFVRWRKKQQAMQATPTMPVWTPPFEATGNIAPIIEVEYKRLPS